MSYKWPRWVYPQTEKQRIIWAYKILFLDTLFPLRVKKVVAEVLFSVDHLCRRGPGQSGRSQGALGHGYPQPRLRLHAAVHLESGDKGIHGASRAADSLVVLDTRLLEGSPAGKAVSHQRFVQSRSGGTFLLDFSHSSFGSGAWEIF